MKKVTEALADDNRWVDCYCLFYFSSSRGVCFNKPIPLFWCTDKYLNWKCRWRRTPKNWRGWKLRQRTWRTTSQQCLCKLNVYIYTLTMRRCGVSSRMIVSSPASWAVLWVRLCPSLLCLYHLRLSEWRFGDVSESSTVYMFLYDTFHLQVTYEDSNGEVFSQLIFSMRLQLIIFHLSFDSLLHSLFLLYICFFFHRFSGEAADNNLEKKIVHIAFHHHIDGEETENSE